MRSMQLEKEQLAAASSLQQYDDYGTPIPPTFSPQRSFSGGMPFLSPTQQYSQNPIPTMPSMPHLSSYNSVQSLNSAVSTPALPVPPPIPAAPMKSAATELDLNDPATLEIYSRILLFKDDPMRDELAFSRALSAKQRRVVHLVAQKLGVYHYSVGEGDDRYAVVTRINPEAVSSSSILHSETIVMTPLFSSSSSPSPASLARRRPTTSPRRRSRPRRTCAPRSRCPT
jgi:hypothetical protein